MVLAHGASFLEVHVRRFPSTVLLSRNPESYFSTSQLPWCFQSRILPRFFLKSRVPCFKYGKFRIPKTYWGPCIRHYEAENLFKSSKLRSFPENFDKFASTIIVKWWSTATTCESIWLLNKGVTDLNFSSANVIQVRHCRDNKGATICGTSATVLLWICRLNRQLQCATKHYHRIKVPPFINSPKTL